MGSDRLIYPGELDLGLYLFSSRFHHPEGFKQILIGYLCLRNSKIGINDTDLIEDIMPCDSREKTQLPVCFLQSIFSPFPFIDVMAYSLDKNNLSMSIENW